MLSGRPEKPPSALLHALADSVVGALSSIALSDSMCFVKLAETHTPLAFERSLSLHDKISRDIDRCLVTDMNVRLQRARPCSSIFL